MPREALRLMSAGIGGDHRQAAHRSPSIAQSAEIARDLDAFSETNRRWPKAGCDRPTRKISLGRRPVRSSSRPNRFRSGRRRSISQAAGRGPPCGGRPVAARRGTPRIAHRSALERRGSGWSRCRRPASYRGIAGSAPNACAPAPRSMEAPSRRTTGIRPARRWSSFISGPGCVSTAH